MSAERVTPEQLRTLASACRRDHRGDGHTAMLEIAASTIEALERELREAKDGIEWYRAWFQRLDRAYDELPDKVRGREGMRFLDMACDMLSEARP